MKKYLKVLFVFILGIMFIPMVHAQNLPQKGVTYFLSYPNGEEYATVNYNEAANPTERLIYSGVTDQNGNIQLCDWAREGNIRIVQHVPDGYTTNEREIKLDLSKTSSATFTNYKGLVNPTTGRTLLFVVVIAGVIAITVVSRKNKKTISNNIILPVIAGALLFTSVKAITCPCITVKDGQGKPLVGVQVDIYATPIEVDAAPAIKFDANGGTFFDGTTEMYVRIPSSPCTFDEFRDFISDEEFGVISRNLTYAYRDGYYQNGLDEPEEYVNGSVLKLQWERDDEAHLIEINGNGGVIRFNGKTISKTYTYADGSNIEAIIGMFERDDYNVIGFDYTPACNKYNSYGLDTTGTGEVSPSSTFYACWNSRPDGIYINDVLFLGNDETCYRESYADPVDNGFYLYSLHGDEIYIGDVFSDDVFFSTLHRSENGYMPLKGGREMSSIVTGTEPVTKVEIVKNGRIILTLNFEDIEEDGNYYVLNDDKRVILLDYLQEVAGCYWS